MNYSSNIYIDASHNGEKLIIGLRHQHDTVWNYEEVIVSMPYIEERCQELIHQINISSRTGDQQQLMSSLISMGSQLCDMMIPSHLKEKLRNTKGDHLFLTIDEHLVHIPWELLCVGDWFQEVKRNIMLSCD